MYCPALGLTTSQPGRLHFFNGDITTVHWNKITQCGSIKAKAFFCSDIFAIWSITEKVKRRVKEKKKSLLSQNKQRI